MYALVTAGCGAIVVNSDTGALGHVGVALTFGLGIMVMIASVGHISGAHFNPAVTVAFALARHLPWRDVPAYVLAQIAGAVSGAPPSACSSRIQTASVRRCPRGALCARSVWRCS